MSTTDSIDPTTAARGAWGGQAIRRGIVGAGCLGLVRLGLTWTPASAAELWPVRLGELDHALLGALAVAAACLVASALASASPRLARVLAVPLVFVTLLGWPAHVPIARLADTIGAEPWHALVALVAAILGAGYLTPGTGARPVPRAALAAGALALIGALSAGPWMARRVERGLPALGGERTVLSLLGDPSLLDVRTENPDRPVRVSTFAAHSLTQFDSGNLPMLETVAPAEVRIVIPRTSPGAVLRLAAGIASDSYVSSERTSVVLDARFENAAPEVARLTTWEGASAQRRTWKRAEIPVGAGGTLVLRSTFDGPPAEAPRAGFGLLEIVRPVEGRRTLASRRAPNVVLVVIDTLRADRLGVYGHERHPSPELDALAGRGTLFGTAYSSASWTWPSTASLLTSLSPPEHGVTDPTSCYVSDGLVTLAEVFQDHGFTTAAFSSNPLVSADKNFDKGFESFREYRWDPASVVLGDASDWLRRMGRYRFFLYLHLIDPHGPYEPDAEFVERFALPVPRRYSESGHKRLVDAVRLSRDVDYAQLERNSEYLSSLYDGEVATADKALGGLFALLEELGLAERTVIAVTSDHGEEFLDHGMMGHGRQVYPESVEVPLILAGPGVPRGARVDVPVENRFLGPTLFGLAGVSPRDNLAGKPDLLDRADLDLRGSEPIFFSSALGWWPGEGARPLFAVRHGALLLIWSAPIPANGDVGARDELAALFDLARDPDTRQNVAADRPGEVERLSGLIEGWLESGARVRPTVFDGGAEVREMLEDLGYLGGAEEPKPTEPAEETHD
jgi:arylsulfatase A-like enzyme